MIITITGRSGSGKNTLADSLVKFGGYTRCVTTTTREPRKGEEAGRDYYYVTEGIFSELHFLESTEFGFYKYGLTTDEIHRIDRLGNTPVFVCDPNGVRAVKKTYGESNVYSVYLQCDEDVVYERMIGRGDSIESVKERLANDSKRIPLVLDLYNMLLVSENGSRSADIEAELIHRIVRDLL